MTNTTLYLDCVSGISGDMLVGALADLGVPEEVFHNALAALDLPQVTLDFRRESRQGISGVKFRVLVDGKSVGETQHSHDALPAGPPPAAPDHSHHQHHHGRTHREIRSLLTRATSLPQEVRDRALAVFHRIAVAEGKIHTMCPDDVHFHEVGAEDSIADIVCACAGLHALAPTLILCSKLFEGTGTVHCAHGHYPLPAPATAEILKNIPLRQINRHFEFITPTGAALAAEFSSDFLPMPEMSVSHIAYGLGTKDPPLSPNVLRALLASSSNPTHTPNHPPGNTDLVVLSEANLDDCTPEVAADACERLFEAGALDVWLTQVIMKRGRPGFCLHAMFEEKYKDAIADQLFKHTTTLGIRFSRMTRLIQTRWSLKVAGSWGEVRVKIGEWGGGERVVSPEYVDCRDVAVRAGVAVREVMDEARELAKRELGVRGGRVGGLTAE